MLVMYGAELLESRPCESPRMHCDLEELSRMTTIDMICFEECNLLSAKFQSLG